MPISRLHAESLEQLRDIQSEAARRLTDNPAIARLFLNDPVQALEAVSVTLSPRAIEQWRVLVGRLPAISADSFALLRDSAPPADLVIRIHGLLPPAGVPAEPEETP